MNLSSANWGRFAFYWFVLLSTAGFGVLIYLQSLDAVRPAEGDLSVELERTVIGPLQGKEGGIADKSYCCFYLRVTNKSNSKAIHFDSWERAGSSQPKMTDEFGSYYSICDSARLVAEPESTIYPGKSTHVAVVFEKPFDKAKVLYLRLPGWNAGLNSDVRFEIAPESPPSVREKIEPNTTELGLSASPNDSPKNEFPVPGQPLKEFVAGYETRLIQGFLVLFSTQAIREAMAQQGKPFEAIDAEFNRIVEVIPPNRLPEVRKVAIWVEWDHVDHSYPEILARYRARGHSLYSTYDERKTNSIELLSLKRLVDEKKQKRARNVMLHELAHAFHHKIVSFDNPDVKFAYSQAMERRLYENAMHDDGLRKKGYAATNDLEYFAELTCMYLDRCPYYPSTRNELKEYDVGGYKLMQKIWGDSDSEK